MFMTFVYLLLKEIKPTTLMSLHTIKYIHDADGIARSSHNYASSDARIKKFGIHKGNNRNCRFQKYLQVWSGWQQEFGG
jgi:hypothetical protein